jgi:hypothetical protein
MSTGRWKHKLSKYQALSSAEKWTLLHAMVWLALARLMLLILPFKKLAERLPGEQGSAGEGPDAELLERIGFAVRTAAANVPWRSDCFPQSIAGWMLLRHHGYGSTIHLGVERSGADDLIGHAWLTCGETVVTGGEDLGRYTEIHRLGA